MAVFKRIAVLCVVAVSLILNGCANSLTRAMNSTDIQNIDFSKSFKSSEACQTRILFFPQTGEASVMAAAKAGGISTVELVDYKTFSAIILNKGCVKVWGH